MDTTTTQDAVDRAVESGTTVTVCLSQGTNITGQLMRSPQDPDKVLVVEVGNGWTSPAFYPDLIAEVVWEQ